MSEAKLKGVRFLNFHYEYDETAPIGNQLDNKLNVQYGMPKTKDQKIGAVRIKFQLSTQNSMAITASGEMIAEFDLSEFEEEITKELLERVCWEKTYEAYAQRLSELLRELGTITGVNTGTAKDIK